MIMTEREVKMAWNNRALSESRMIKCLAELNVCSENDMIEYCTLIGIELNQRPLAKCKSTCKWTAKEDAILYRGRLDGKTYEEISKMVGHPVNSCQNRYYSVVRAKYC